MEGIITLIIIIIAFNIFNALIKAVRGSQKAPQKKAFVVPQQLPPHEKGQLLNEDEVRFRLKKKEKGSYFYDDEGNDVQEAESAGERDKWLSPEPVNREVATQTPVSVGLQKVLTRRDPLLAAFIFHEILEPPPTLRRKR